MGTDVHNSIFRICSSWLSRLPQVFLAFFKIKIIRHLHWISKNVNHRKDPQLLNREICLSFSQSKWKGKHNQRFSCNEVDTRIGCEGKWCKNQTFRFGVLSIFPLLTISSVFILLLAFSQVSGRHCTGLGAWAAPPVGSGVARMAWRLARVPPQATRIICHFRTQSNGGLTAAGDWQTSNLARNFLKRIPREFSKIARGTFRN